MRAEVLRGHVDLLLLATLREGPLHGYGIVESLRSASAGAFDLAEGTVYPALYRLEAAGLLSSRWTKAAGRRRRVYELTRHGRGELARSRDEWRSFANAVEAVVT
ncbi:MAG TPA: helix-turn-helix transcriptional regulator [Gaiellaceae bacterium]|nr:helix-turn-helix transcriptional regulator [Gaiellaceae bacterium]